MGDLTGKQILVVEDSYLEGHHKCEALRKAGAVIIGPIANAEDALQVICQKMLNLAIVDLDLGHGPQFEVARSLASRGIPFLVASAYEPDILPDDLRDRPILQKPFEDRLMVMAAAEILVGAWATPSAETSAYQP